MLKQRNSKMAGTQPPAIYYVRQLVDGYVMYYMAMSTIGTGRWERVFKAPGKTKREACDRLLEKIQRFKINKKLGAT